MATDDAPASPPGIARCGDRRRTGESTGNSPVWRPTTRRRVQREWSGGATGDGPASRPGTARCGDRRRARESTANGTAWRRHAPAAPPVTRRRGGGRRAGSPREGHGVATDDALAMPPTSHGGDDRARSGDEPEQPRRVNEGASKQICRLSRRPPVGRHFIRQIEAVQNAQNRREPAPPRWHSRCGSQRHGALDRSS